MVHDPPVTDSTAADVAIPQQSQPRVPRGIFDGFESYRSPSDADLERVMTTGLVAVDANVLLDLYRYTEQGRRLLLSVLAKIGDQLWIPDQVMQEFWRHRAGAVNAPRSSANNTIKELRDVQGNARGILRNWAARFALPEDDLESISRNFDEVFNGAVAALNRLVAKHAGPADLDTGADSVIGQLNQYLSGRVGPRFAKDEHDRLVTEGKRRIAQKIPPGYMDAGKGENSVGDFLVWWQIIIEARHRRCDVLLVTGDVKEDWWRNENREARGPRQELIDELSKEVGARLYMLTPRQFTKFGARLYAIDSAETGLDDIDRVDRSREEAAESLQGEWNLTALDALFRMLSAAGYQDRVAVIKWAADNEGFIGQDTIRELCGYSQEAKLNGLVRPISRLTADLQDVGLLSRNVPPLLSAVYDPKYSYVKASGFLLHASVESMVQELDESGNSEAE